MRRGVDDVGPKQGASDGGAADQHHDSIIDTEQQSTHHSHSPATSSSCALALFRCWPTWLCADAMSTGAPSRRWMLWYFCEKRRRCDGTADLMDYSARLDGVRVVVDGLRIWGHV